MIEALKIIISKSSPQVARYAMKALAAFESGSPLAVTRYNQVLQDALAEGTDFSPEERKILAASVSAAPTEKRENRLQLRLTDTEYLAIEEAARADGASSVSEWVRKKLLLE